MNEKKKKRKVRGFFCRSTSIQTNLRRTTEQIERFQVSSNFTKKTEDRYTPEFVLNLAILVSSPAENVGERSAQLLPLEGKGLFNFSLALSLILSRLFSLAISFLFAPLASFFAPLSLSKLSSWRYQRKEERNARRTVT